MWVKHKRHFVRSVSLREGGAFVGVTVDFDCALFILTVECLLAVGLCALGVSHYQM